MFLLARRIMERAPKPPKTYEAFVQRYPKIAQAWEMPGPLAW
jgi:hypothetical protein